MRESDKGRSGASDRFEYRRLFGFEDYAFCLVCHSRCLEHHDGTSLERREDGLAIMRRYAPLAFAAIVVNGNLRSRLAPTDPGKSLRQDMLHEAAEELFVGKRHYAALAVMGVVFPSKADPAVVHRQEAMIGDGHTMGVASQVLQDVIWRTC